MKSIRIVLPPNSSEVRVEVSGFSGPECLKATKNVEEAIGGVVDRTKKPEFYQSGTLGGTSVSGG